MTRVEIVAPAGVGPGHGIVDQARLAAGHLRRRGHDARVHIVVSPGARVPAPVEGRGTTETVSSLQSVWTRLHDPDLLWVQWANYGLSRINPVGAPVGFCRRLERWRRDNPGATLALSVHEGWDEPADRRTWKRQRAAVQRATVKRAAGLADKVSTNCTRWADGLSAVQPALMPTYSNFPEPSGGLRSGPRRDIAVMGTAPVREGLLRGLECTDDWGPVSPASAGVVHLIGQSPFPHQSVSGLAIVKHDFPAAQEVSDVLSSCALGVIDIPTDVLGKSSIAAAYRELGLTTLNLADGALIPPDSDLLGGLSKTVDWLLSGG